MRGVLYGGKDSKLIIGEYCITWKGGRSADNG